MFHTFNALTADDVWQQVADEFRCNKAITLRQASRAGDTREILHVCLSISDSRQRWIPSRMPPLNVAFALAEIIWIVRGRNDSAFLNYFNNELRKFAGEGATYHGAYGYRLRKTFGVDQLERARTTFANNPDSRQVVLQLWDAKQDLPNEKGREADSDIPCNVSALLKVRNRRLEWTQVMRSNDVFRGLPYNLVQFTALQEVLAGWLGLEPGGYYHISDSLHVYENCIEKVRMAKPVHVVRSTDSLALPKLQSDAVFAVLEDAVKVIASNEAAAEEIQDLAAVSDLPTPFRNILCILSAEGLRRRRRYDLLGQVVGRCTNGAYVQLFEAWLSRWPRKQPEAA